MNKQELQKAISRAQVWTDGHEDSTGILFQVGVLRLLTYAARCALELVDFANPPLLPEDLTRMKRRHRAKRALTGSKRPSNRKPGLAKLSLPEVEG